MEKLYQIKNGAVTMFLEHYKGKEFHFKGFTIANDTENYYTDSNVGDPCPPRRKSIYLTEYLYQMYKSEADDQLKEYIDNHINDYDFYREYGEEGFTFWNKIMNSAGSEPRIINHYDLDLSEITDGIAIITIKQIQCRYSFVERKTIEFISPRHYSKVNTVTSSLEIFYKDYLDEFVALEQYRRGISVPAYAELVRMKEFLKDKKSVKILLKSGAIHELKKDSLRVTDVLRHYSDNDRLMFCLNNSYHLKPNIERNLPLSSLDYLQFGNQKFYINEKKLADCAKPNIRKGA